MRSSRLCLSIFSTALFLCVSVVAFGDPATFDLNGPTIEVKVTRGGQTLPITQVPNLAVGDKLWIRPDFPDDQAVRYLLIAAFLNGSTNTPPERWFYKADTWNKKFEGLTVTVPQGAQQVLLFLAPETGGDFKTVMSAVRGQPGAFVRASQDLNQASLDRSRLDTYLDAVRKINATDPENLKVVSPLLARSLAIKLNPDCLTMDNNEIAPCLTDKQDSLVLNDGHSTSIVNALTSGPAGDLAMQASYTPQANFGYYSPYIASAMDIARILDSFHTAEYQYIPALAEQRDGTLALKLNAPPSFHNPKSVLVIALPAVEAAQPPPLHPVDESQVYCAQKTTLALPVDGAPLVFSTGYARDLTLHLQAADGKSVDLPLKSDAVEGGLLVDTKPLAGTVLGTDVKASIRGYWGFEPFTGPVVHLQGAHQQTWKIAEADENTLVVGRDDTLHLEADDASCVEGIQFRGADGKEIKANWKLVKPNQVEVTLPLKDAQPGAMTLVVNQAGLEKPEDLSVRAFAEAGHLESFTVHAGDPYGTMAGTRLDEVASLSMKGIEFKPGTLTATQGADLLQMETTDTKAARALKEGEILPAVVTLRDGRTVDLKATIDAARPSVTLISKSIEADSDTGNTAASNNIQLSGKNELPQNATLLFSLKAVTPERFSRDEKIEVATDDGSYSTMLTQANGLTLQDAHTAVATLNPAKAFGASAFGPLQFRVVTETDVKGDWQPLATLVRLPTFRSLQCKQADAPCELKGSDLFLVDSIALNPQFTNPVQVPDGFPGNALEVPRPADGGQLYVKLRDDPSTVNLVTLAPLMPKEKKSAQAQAAQPKFRPEYVSPGDNPAPAPVTPAQEQTPAQGQAPAPVAQQPASANPGTNVPPSPPASSAAAPASGTAQTSGSTASSPHPQAEEAAPSAASAASSQKPAPAPPSSQF